MSFIHLHVHSQYSFLDGASSLDKLLEKAKALNMPALAITDHNKLTGAIRFYEKAKVLGIKPIVGTEIDLEEGHHLTLRCKNKKDYTSLCRLLAEAHMTNKGKQPCVTKEVLGKFSAGLIALSGCSRGELPTLIGEGKTEQARKAAIRKD